MRKTNSKYNSDNNGVIKDESHDTSYEHCQSKEIEKVTNFNQNPNPPTFVQPIMTESNTPITFSKIGSAPIQPTLQF